MRLTRRISVIVLAVLALTAVGRQAAAQTQTASEFYMAYRAAFDKATKIEDLLPYMSKENSAKVASTPAKDKEQMFGMMKMMGTITNVKVAKETKTPTGATLTVNALDSDKKPTTGKVDLIQEAGKWKIGSESWSS